MTEILENSTDAGCSVEMTCVNGEWLVRIVDNGRQTTQHFSVASHARAFADGQKIRLGLGLFGERQTKAPEGESGDSHRPPD
jgi:hypothetical protein